MWRKLSAICLLFCGCLLLGEESAKVRGGYLRTEIRSTSKIESFRVKVVNHAQKGLGFELRLWNILKHQEVKIYEAKLRVKRGESFDFVPLPGETVEGEPSMREEEVDAGALIGEKLYVDGMSLLTDQEGFLPESALQVLRNFDALGTRSLKYRFHNSRLGLQEVTIYRTMPRRAMTDEKTLEEPVDKDILMVMGCDFQQRLQEPEREGLQIELVGWPERLRGGEKVSLAVKITNNGTRETSCLLGRLFSREPWLNGMLFYFGAVKPGQSAIFTRQAEVPESLKTEVCFAALAFQDSWGELAQQKHEISFRVVQSAGK